MYLLARLARIRFGIESLSSPLEHWHMIHALLRIPRELPGCVVECGSYKGSSTSALSIGCRISGRTLHVFDSFRGLPAPTEIDSEHYSVGRSRSNGDSYRKGQFAASLEEVRKNVSRYGELAVCQFHEGFFSETLPSFREPVVLAFMDVDLLSSAEHCVRHFWPLLQPGCRLYTHEARDYAISSLFYDKNWWRDIFGCHPPGLVGAGNGLGLLFSREGFYSNLGYVVKPDGVPTVF